MPDYTLSVHAALYITLFVIGVLISAADLFLGEIL